MSTLVTILRPIVQLGMNSWLDFGSRRVGSQLPRGIGDGLRPVALSHGENRGSSPLGSANNFNDLAGTKLDLWATSPTFLQWTLLPKIGSRSPCDLPLEE